MVEDARAGRPAEVPAEVVALGAVLALERGDPIAARRWISSASASMRPAKRPSCRYGATIMWPDVYGNRFMSTKALSPRCTTSGSSGSQKMQRSESSSSRSMYSSRHGAQSGLVIRLSSHEP